MLLTPKRMFLIDKFSEDTPLKRLSKPRRCWTAIYCFTKTHKAVQTTALATCRYYQIRLVFMPGWRTWASSDGDRRRGKKKWSWWNHCSRQRGQYRTLCAYTHTHILVYTTLKYQTWSVRPEGDLQKIWLYVMKHTKDHIFTESQYFLSISQYFYDDKWEIKVCILPVSARSSHTQRIIIKVTCCKESA